MIQSQSLGQTQQLLKDFPLEQAQTSVQLITIDESAMGQRVDNYLVRILKGVPKTHIYKLLRKGEVRVNKGRIKPVYRLQLGDIVRIAPVLQKASAAPVLNDQFLECLRAAILYEDEQLLVINKPSGLAVHGGSGVQYGLIEGLRQLYPDQVELELVHRLDRATSGCILVAKKRSMLKSLHELLRDNQMTKTYWALVKGRWPKKKLLVQAPLLKNTLKSGERMVHVSSRGKPALTEFCPLQLGAEVSLVSASPVTGRTHQIRVHAQYSGHPLAGDEKYGDRDFDKLMQEKGLNRLFLHAKSIAFSVAGKPYAAEAPLPEVLIQVLQNLDLRVPD